MTTKVTVTASGSTYPARVVHVRKPQQGEREVMLDKLVASGESVDVWCGTSDTITVTEEYHPAGYPAPASEPEAKAEGDQAEAAAG